MALRLTDGRLIGGDSEIAKLTGRSTRTVREWRAKGWLPPANAAGIDLTTALPALFDRMAEQAAGRASAEDDGLDLIAERARLAKEQADATAMRNAVMRGELIPAQDLEAVAGALVDAIRAKLLSLPNKAAPRVAGQTLPAAREVLTDLVHEALADLAGAQIVATAADRAQQRVGRAVEGAH